MRISVEEQVRRAKVEALNRVEDLHYHADDIDEIRCAAIKQFTKELDAKIKNTQWAIGERLGVVFSIDVIRPNGKVRGGSGSQRNMPEYIEWRSAVFGRDGYRCQECGASGQMNAHHIKSWSGYPELRFDIENGVTLCFDCHAKKHPHISYFS